MEFSTYLNYTVKDFLGDDTFISWITNPTDKKDQFWQSFLNKYPEKEEEVSRAAQVIKAYRKQDTSFNRQNQLNVWNRIEASIRTQKQVPAKVISRPVWLRMAAVFLLATGIAFTIWQFNRQETISTGFGEIRTVILPDQSEVILNSNSDLTYFSGWYFHSREVWINGEVLFKVKHFNRDSLNIKPSERFYVHSNGIEVEVLGTTFNVKSRHEKTNVSLLNGKIKIAYLSSFAKKESLMMKPGDDLEFNHNRLVAKKVLARPADITLWTARRLIFNNPSLRKIIETLQDEYGYQVNVTDPLLQNLKIDGEIKVSGVEELLETIASTLHLRISQSDKNIIISKISK